MKVLLWLPSMDLYSDRIESTPAHDPMVIDCEQGD